MLKWIKKNWKTVVKIVTILITVVVGIILGKKGITAIIGKVSKPVRFLPDYEDKTKFYVKDGEKFVSVKLPIDKKGKRLIYEKIKAAGLSKTVNGETKVKVEVLHEVTNRRNGIPIDNSAASKLGK